jgi:hypothetical protein
VFVVADEAAFGVGGERSFAGAGEAEEESGVAALPTFAEQCIGKTPFCGSR